ncbi:MAG: sulfite exporter TauE/SafE family protein [Phycisphaerales bacterium]|nr:sulfite exporter TauE/SafE family protein [Phycisphaerales bacterium]MCB9857521.1 sulfite exporter TauE/SafE family protein [Phycisphaerales bacterium]MCB9864494.1 sulfite exporter TauE/SafE family protein [Phycisphaerales bacterium]
MFTIPPLFQDSIALYLLSLLILITGQIIYATVGFGAGMFAVTLLVILLKDLPGVVSTILCLTWITEVLVLSREWRHVWGRLLFVIVPPLFLGVWIGTKLLAAGNGEALKVALGGFVAAAGIHFLITELRGRNGTSQLDATAAKSQSIRPLMAAICIPVATMSGVLGGCFGTGGPPIIVLFKSLRLDKRTFRATLLAFFFATSISRITSGITLGTLGMTNVHAALWLAPGAVIGTILGAQIYKRLSEHHFARIVSVLITVLGLTLIVTSIGQAR